MEIAKKILTYESQYQTKVANGLSQADVENRLAEYGENRLPEKQPKSFLQYLIDALKDITIIILLIATALSTYVALTNHPDDLTEPIVIFGIVLLNLYLSINQQKKAEKSMDKLKSFSIPQAKVKRVEGTETIDSTKIVPGDIVLLGVGDRVPADGVLVSATDFLVDESFLTGESEPSEKNPNQFSAADASLGDRKDRVFSGSLVTSGKAEMIVTETADKTEIGKISNLLQTEEVKPAPLQVRMQKLGKILGAVAIFAGLLAIVIGLLRGYPLTEILMIAISMSVAAIPEVLPVVVTISLSYGMSNMAKKNTIVRTPMAVETVGNLSVICSDKTGTITQNKMTVKKVWLPDGGLKKVDETLSADEKKLIQYFYLASDRETGNPTELAINKLTQNQFTYSEVETFMADYQKIKEVPFDSSRKQMTVVYQVDDGFLSITKGAFDRLKFQDQPQEAVAIHDELAADAYRVLALGYKFWSTNPQDFTTDQLENELTFGGFIGIIDPARAESAPAVAMAKKAGIRTIMITGDHLLTAKKIARQVNILTDGQKAMTGADLAKLSDEDLNQQIDQYSVFARTSPEDKIRIVKALQQNNEVVGMTGDGVNDAPALKAADVGIAMGGGTEVAKEAADMVLLDDNFATIVDAIKEGRRVYSNIRKSLYAMLGCNISALSIVLISLLAGWGAPVTAIQLLLIKVVADGIPGFSLCVEPADDDIMTRQPIKKGTSIFAGGLLKNIVDISIVFTVLSLIAVVAAKYTNLFAGNNSMIFLVLGLTTIVHMYNCRSKRSIFKLGILSNKLLLTTTIAGSIILMLVVITPSVGSVFGLTNISGLSWILVAILSIMPLVYVEVKKRLGLFGQKEKNLNLGKSYKVS
ncbi:cation-translocating P-type ATPase [Enterococcus alishanensis]|uniref:Cation-translocating P-type ATPase n=1 Tax=Enterococcus alishanensis TaxID=1303817 RepID=A0ABS6TGF5_9ENTE|nr:cation-translocating P-type ATPase [Enterococcus alishanensis]MBV7392013.1 cation-translocating P-type ATPase [Enterococcus alishanensis]